MSVESLTNAKYSQASDVWAFGVLCWEVFSFAQDPYTGVFTNIVMSIQAMIVSCYVAFVNNMIALWTSNDWFLDMTAETAVRAVLQGYRMPRPSLCPTDLFGY